MHQRNLIEELAQALDKTEEEVQQFLKAPWQGLSVFVEIEPPSVCYSDAKIDGVRSTYHVCCVDRHFHSKPFALTEG